MEMLERYYSGDKDLNDFALSFSEFKDLEQVIATVICGKVGSVGAKDWIYKKVNTLDKVRPIDCTEDKNLLNRLRVALMRMPC